MYAEQLPPHDIAAEESVIGSLLVDGEAITQIAGMLKPEDFYREQHKWCYEACLSLYHRNEAINQVTLGHELTTGNHFEEMGGSAYLTYLAASVPTSVHIEYYANIVSRTSIMRGIINAAGEIASIGYENDANVEEALTKAENTLYRIRNTQPSRDFVPIRELLDTYLAETASTRRTDREVAPDATGFTDLDQLLGGFQRSDLIILAARPSVGKSALALNIATNVAKQGAVVAIFSLEMSCEQVVLRLLANEAEVSGHRLRLGLYTEAEGNQVTHAIGELSDLTVYIDDTPMQGITQMRSKARRLHLEKGVDLIIVDYLQLVSGSSRTDNRVQEVGEISRALKAIARDLNVPVLAVSQLSRAIEQRPSHRPILSDLRESGSIEQDADVVAFIHREESHYNEEEWEKRFPHRPYPKGIAELIIAKHRHGPVDTVNMFFRDRLARFENFTTREESK